MPILVSFATNAAAVPGIGTAYGAEQVIALTYVASIDGTAPALPSGGWFDHLELNATIASGSPATGFAKLCWDATGDVLASAVATLTFEPGVSTLTKVGTVANFQGWYRNPVASAQGVTTLYLFVKVNAGAIDVAIGGARLHGHDNAAGA